ncbi:hypothetical protein CHS0354_032302 [Potamilus streckersoni]|uniref:SEC7 domain-containing protein n=1 Tax=Potamilus streckersoni TaxID=2493646 RepID=A0AAE0RPT9_9BIVA|nr:hypothetical protein CHS0354_032302 [Potamilus streckersoni]
MEELLQSLIRDASAGKFSSLRKSCQAALDLLNNKDEVSTVPAYVLREKCLEPLQLALETRVKRLTTCAVSGIEKMLKDERFQSSLEADREEKWLPVQVLNAVYSTSNLPEDIQVDIIKLLLKMTFSNTLCMNARVITKVSQVYIDTYCTSANSVRGAIQAALTQLLGSFAEKLHNVNTAVDDDSDVLADFNAKGNSDAESLSKDIVTLLKFLIDKVVQAQSANQNKQAVPLLLEGIHAILVNSAHTLNLNAGFQELIWKNLCPTLISLFGIPKAEPKTNQQLKSATVQEEMGRGSGGSTVDPRLTPSTAKTIFNIAVELTKMVGPVRSLRPVLESLFHRILLCPAPQHRHDALKALRELLSSPEKVCNMTVTYVEDISGAKSTSSTTPHTDLALLKLMVDSLQECCHSNDSAVCITSVICADELLGSVIHLCQGVGIASQASSVIHQRYSDSYLKRRAESVSESSVPDFPSRKKKFSGDNDSSILPASFISSEPKDDQIQGQTDKGERQYNMGQDQDHLSQYQDYQVQGQSNQSLRQADADDKGQGQSDQDQEQEINSFTTCKEDQIFACEETVDKHEETRKRKLTRCCSKAEYHVVEKQNALDFVKALLDTVPNLMELADINDVDRALQQFSSNCVALICGQFSGDARSYPMNAILNGDGVYITSVAALSLSLKLQKLNFYATGDRSLIKVTENEFLDSILGSGMLLYVSQNWLTEVYRAILDTDLLSAASAQVVSGTQLDHSALITMLKDLDGLDSHEAGGQLLNGLTATNFDVDQNKSDSVVVEAGKKLARQILSSCWDGLLDILSVLLNGRSSCGITSSLALMLGTEGAREESYKAREAICTSLAGLQKAAQLCCNLGLQRRCEIVFALLANTSCVMEEQKHSQTVDIKAHKLPPIIQTKAKDVQLHASHVLSMDSIITAGLEMSSHSRDCWKHVFRCSAFISELEHIYFSSGKNQCNLPIIQQEQLTDSHIANENEDDPELYSVPVVPAVPVAARINVQELIRQSRVESGWDRSISGGGVLNSTQASQAVCELSQAVDRLFEDAANILNMQALLAFLVELCEASKQQLHKISKKIQEEEELPFAEPHLPVNSLHLYRLQHVLMKIVHSDRPLIHLLRAWITVSLHLVEAAGHRDRSISKMAVSCVHDYIIAVLSRYQELPYFHTNEMLCKAFENILCLELCDGDVQDQIVCSICELVEASAAEIRSGWRPLFGALRAVRIEYTTIEEVNEARQRHIEAVLDVFDVYLNTDNILVFANATVDCILCLLKYVRGPGEFEDSDDDDSDSVNDYMMSSPSSENLCFPALKYLKQCSGILQSMWTMPACPVFHGADRIQINSPGKIVDPNIPNMNFEKYSSFFPQEDSYCDSENPETKPNDRQTEGQSKSGSVVDHSIELTQIVDEEKLFDCGSLASTDSGIGVLSEKLHPTGHAVEIKLNENSNQTNKPERPSIFSFEHLDNKTGILNVWYLLIEGLAGALSACPKSYQPQTMETLFELLKSVSKVPGPHFAISCVNHLLLPMLQSWLRWGSHKYRFWETGATNFKQCCGHTTDLLVDFIKEFIDDTSLHLEMVMKQLLLVLTECVAQPIEVISRLGCSCIRHILLSAGAHFTNSMWQIAVDGLENALKVTTYPLRQLMLLFHVNSENFYGDIGQVKVATRKDCTATECVRMCHLAQQVFQLDSQVNTASAEPESEEDKSFVFLIYPPGHENSFNPDHILSRVPFRSIVVGLLSHQLLLQTVGCVFLEDVFNESGIGNQTEKSNISGMLSCMTTSHAKQLLDCLRSSYNIACEFDSRPGLKFLIQKVARTGVAVNLYKQAGASMVFYIHTLIKICSSMPDLSRDSILAFLDKQNTALSLHNTREVIERESNTAVNSVGNSNDSESNNMHGSSNTFQTDEKSSLKCDEKPNMERKLEDQSSVSSKDKLGSQKHKNPCSASSAKKLNSTENGVFPVKGNLHAKVWESPDLFLPLLQAVCDELCDTYINILLNTEGTSCVDRMAEQQLFFLIAQADDLPISTKKKKITQADTDGDAHIKTSSISTETVSVDGNLEEEENHTVIHKSLAEEHTLPPNSPIKSKKEMRFDQESKVYNLATDKLIKNLMTEYKKRKNQHAMPNFVRMAKKKETSRVKKKPSTSGDPVDEVIEQQKQSSIMKDSEAHIQSWTELLCSIMALFQQLPDEKFQTLLPTVFNCVNHLICHAADMRLREALASWLHRVGQLYHLSPCEGKLQNTAHSWTTTAPSHSR